MFSINTHVLENRLNRCGSLYNFVGDIKKGKILMATAKMVAITTLVTPVILGIGYLVTKARISYLNNRYASIEGKIKLITEKNSKKLISQSNLIFYCLFNKVNESENSLFNIAFEMLESESRDKLYAHMANNGLLPRVVDLLDENIEKLHINICKSSCKDIEEFLKDLAKKCCNLDEITFDLSWTLRFDSSIENKLNDINNLVESSIEDSKEALSSNNNVHSNNFGRLNAIITNISPLMITYPENKKLRKKITLNFLVSYHVFGLIHCYSVEQNSEKDKIFEVFNNETYVYQS